MSTLKLDHIVYAVPDLEEGIKHIHEKLGIKPVYGGKHLLEGTHNALLKLADGCYFEIIAPDPENKSIRSPRWMGVDLVQSPCISRWAVKSTNIKKDLGFLMKISQSLGHSKEGQRLTSEENLLKWELSIPLPEPLVESIPFLIDWKDSIHPSEGLESYCKIKSLEIGTNRPEELTRLLQSLEIEQQVQHTSENKIQLTISCPAGEVIL